MRVPSLTESIASSEERQAVIEPFRFDNGFILDSLTINYVTVGQPIVNANAEITNAVLLIHGTAGNWQTFAQPWWTDHMFGPGQPLDLNKTFVIISDNLGAGRSSKPSDGLRTNFPRYSHADVVKAQHHLITKELGIKKLKAVLGSSYGGRLAWQWSVQYPSSMEAIIPLIASPFPNAGRRGMQDFLAAETLRKDPSWNHGDYQSQPELLPLSLMIYWVFLDGAQHLWNVAPTRQASWKYLPKVANKIAANLDANDWIYQLHVNDHFDAASSLNRIEAKVFSIELSGDEMVPVELGQIEHVGRLLGSQFDCYLVNEVSGYGHSGLPLSIHVIAPRIQQFLSSLGCH